MVKRYYWLKIQRNFFRQIRVKKLKKMERGNEKVLIYLEMLSLSLENDNKIIFQHVENTFEEEIALELDEDVELVRETLKYLKEQYLVEQMEDEYMFVEVLNLTGSESESNSRVKKSREKKKDNEQDLILKEESSKKEIAEEVLDNKDVTTKNKNVTLCNENVTTETEKEKELDKDIDKREIKTKASVTYLSEKLKNTKDENLSKIIEIYKANMGEIYPANRQWFIEISEKFSADLFEKAVSICIDKKHRTPSYLKGIIRRWESEQIFTLKDLESKNNQYMKNNKPLENNAIEEEEEIDEKILEEMKALEKKLGVS